MTGFTIRSGDHSTIRFRYYTGEAPVTCKAFNALLPFSRTFFHARVSGQEIWADNVPPLDIIQENASVFTLPGEAVYGPLNPKRVKTANCMGVYYGEGKGLDCCNIFAMVFNEDRHLLVQLGNAIWKSGAREITYEPMESTGQAV